MERQPAGPLRAKMDLDSYLVALPGAEVINGVTAEDATQIFYHWLSLKHPQFNMGKVTVEALYLKNVIETGMSVDDFLKYCNNHEIPVPAPIDATDEDQTYYNLEFKFYLKDQELKKRQAYEDWAKANQIPTNPGATMQFFDLEDNEYLVRTDAEHRGEIISEEFA